MSMSRAAFSASIDGTPHYILQWTRNNMPIPGANGLEYTTPPLTAADDGAVYQLSLSNHFSRVTSTAATLTVLHNPWVVSASNRGQPNRVYVLFNKPVVLQPGSGAGYSLDGGIIVHDQAHGVSQSEVVLIPVAPFKKPTI